MCLNSMVLVDFELPEWMKWYGSGLETKVFRAFPYWIRLVNNTVSKILFFDRKVEGDHSYRQSPDEDQGGNPGQAGKQGQENAEETRG